MRRTIRFIAILYLILPCLTAVALAAGDEGNFKKLGAFQMTGTAAGEYIPQEGKYADNLRKIRQTIKLPDGFKIELFAIAPDARHMAVGRNKGTIWIGTRKSKIWAATDRDMDNVADTVEEFSPSVKFDIPKPPAPADEYHCPDAIR